jgi:hypothetical protein
VANGVVYAGAIDPKGYMRALNATTDKILWFFASCGSVASGPAIADGMVFWGSRYEHLDSPTVHQSVKQQHVLRVRSFAGCGKALMIWNSIVPTARLTFHTLT